ncbi:DUF1573 domain-containing protein [Bergeyella sp. RCAD1439]|uniref:DUF1573 domain-containing protein n=1 Tax=Bergeyella anatis TaxID=3113737 RepID=UPI002E18C282|nr:DUF1573 domain-containing protein [Bergeyella sp. RCAD1439]
MKKIILMGAVGAILLASCGGKNESADRLEVEGNALEAHLHAEAQDDLVHAAQDKPMTSLALSESHWDFKDVKKGTSVEHVYEVTNTGENPLIISEVKPGCGCTAPEFTREPIMPGAKGKIVLKFDSSNFDGLQNKQAEVYANVERAPIVLTFSANVVN